jgi:hypothetical protein
MADRATLLKAFAEADKAGDTADAQAFARLLNQAPTEAPTGEAPSTVGDSSTTEDKLRSDPDWIAASRTLHDMNSPPDSPKLDDLAAANYGLDEMGWFNNNSAQMALKAGSIITATPAQQQAFRFLADRSKELSWSGEGVGRVTLGVLTDPLMLSGLVSLGFGSVADIAASTAGKVGLEAVLKAGVQTGARAAVDGGIYGAVRNSGDQAVQDAGTDQQFDYGKLALATGESAAAGFVLGGAVGGAGHFIAGLADKGGAEAVAAADEAHVAPEPSLEADPANASSQPIQAAPSPTEAPLEVPAEPSSPVQAHEVAPPEEPTAPLPEATPAPPEDGPVTVDPTASSPADITAPPPPANSNIPGLTGPGQGFEGHLNAITDAVKDLAHDGPVHVTNDIQSMAALTKATQGISDLITKATRAGDGGSVMDALRQSGMTDYQIQALGHAAQQANEALTKEISALSKQAMATTNKEAGLALRRKVDLLESTRSPVQNFDNELSTQSARDLRARQEFINTGEVRDLSIKSLMEEGGMSRLEAETYFTKVTDERTSAIQNRADLADINQKITAADKANDFTLRQQLMQQRDTILGRSDGQLDKAGQPLAKAYRILNTAAKLVVEVMVSNVLGPATIVKVVIPAYLKLLGKPLLNYLADGVLSTKGFREMTASYAVLATSSGVSFKYAAMSFRYEKAILLRPAEQPFFGHGVIPKSLGGGVVRFFPRMITGADAFMESMAYRQWGISKASADAYEAAGKLGLTGHALDAHVKDAVATATDALYTKDPSHDTHVIDMLMEQGQDRGLGGQKLDNWVRNELNTNGQYLRSATNEAGKNYAKDIMFKREFSGTNWASKIALGYEGFVRNNPMMKIVGQLFFRTPVRIVQEGFRITPGLNLITPGFVADISGKNGSMAAIRARGESMFGVGVAGTVLSLYANGAITGGGPSDFRQVREGTDAGFQPYSIRLPNGSYWSYRNIEPLATPMKIIVNALDKVNELHYRVAQGEQVQQGEFQAAYDYIGVGAASVGQALHDASLLQGVNNTINFVNALSDPKAGNSSDQVLKALGGFLSSAIPSTWTKARSLMTGNQLDDPITIEQMWRAKLNPGDPLVPKQYTATARVRETNNPYSALMVLYPADNDTRFAGIPDKERAVEKDMWVTGQAANTEFLSPIFNHLYPAVPDLRKVNTKDGQETLYDRWQSILRTETLGGRGLVDALDAVAQSSAPYGTPKDHPGESTNQVINGAGRGSLSPRAAAYNQVLNGYRDAAMMTLLKNEGIGLDPLATQDAKDGNAQMSTNINSPFLTP